MSVIESCGLFKGLNPAALNAIAAIADAKSYPAEAFVFQNGDPGRHLYILEKGRIRLRFSEGGQVAYTLSDRGDIFGWSSMVNQAAYTLSAQTVSDVSVIQLDGKKLELILAADPTSGMIFYRNLSEFIGQRLFNSYKATVFVHGERSSLSYG